MEWPCMPRIGGLAEIDHSALPHVHAAHVHAHVAHGQQRPFAQRRDWRDHAHARRQRRAHHARSVDRLGDDAIGRIGAGVTMTS